MDKNVSYSRQVQKPNSYLIKNWKILFMISLLMLYCCDALDNCPSTKPDWPPDDIEEPIEYTIQFTYIRPDVLSRPDLADKLVNVRIKGISRAGINFRMQGNSFEGEFEKKITENENYSALYLYHMWALDQARWDGINDDTAIVGEVFILRVKETGFEKRLYNVRHNNNEGNPSKGPNARMAVFRLMKDGTIRDE